MEALIWIGRSQPYGYPRYLPWCRLGGAPPPQAWRKLQPEKSVPHGLAVLATARMLETLKEHSYF